MTHAPVFYTLAQVRFNPITQMHSFVPQLQDALRRTGYPDFQEEVQAQLRVMPTAADGQPHVETVQQKRWSFNNKNRSKGFLLLQDSIIFHTTSYEGYSSFKLELLDGLKKLHEIVSLAFVQRVGLRYLDAIFFEDSKSVGDLLSSGLVGLGVDDNSVLQHKFTETVTKEDHKTLVARALITMQGAMLPPDLQPLLLEVSDKFKVNDRLTAVLDTDCFLDARIDFDLGEIEDRLNGLHDSIIEVFKKSITDEAKRQWNL